MKATLAAIFLGLSALSAIAVATRPGDPFPNKLRLVRTTDAHPNRVFEAEAFAKANPGLYFTLDYGSNKLEKVIVQCSSGVGPDVFEVYGGSQLQTFVEAGIAQDVNDEAKQMGFSMDDNLWPAARGEVSQNGRQYTYPGNVNANILVYNKTLFKQAGVPYPKQNMTWDEFFVLAQKLNKGTGADRVYGSAPINWGMFFESQRGEVFSPDGTRLLVSQKPMQQAFQLYHDMLFKYRVAPSSLDLKAMSGQGGWGSGSINQFCDGRFAMLPIGKWALANFRPAHQDQLDKHKAWADDPNHKPQDEPQVLKLGSVLLPHFQGMKPCFGVSARSMAINALGTHKKESLKVVAFLATKEYSEILNNAVDAIPGNPKWVNAGLKEGDPDLSELEMHANTIKAMANGYQRRRSPFLLANDVERILSEQISRMEADPDLDIPKSLADAQSTLENLMQRNLDRDPKLKAQYKALTGSEEVVGPQ